MKVEVRRYRDSDFSSVSQLLEQAFSVSMQRDHGESNSIILVASVSDKVVGHLVLTKVLDVILNRCYFLIDYVCVRQDYRNLGIGKELMRYAEHIARKENALYLQLTSSYFRKAAHQLYFHCGFSIRESNIFRKVL